MIIKDSYNYRNAIQVFCFEWDICLLGRLIPITLDFRHERILSNQEINLINDWISFGAPEGNPNLTPPAPNYNTSGPQLGYRFNSSAPIYTSNAFQNDDYVCFTIPSQLLADKKIRAVEVVPGNLLLFITVWYILILQGIHTWSSK